MLRHPAVATANLVMFTGGIGIYLVLSLITRYVQTPPPLVRVRPGHPPGLSRARAFSLLGFVAGRLFPRLRARFSARVLLAGSTAVALAAFVLFALARGHLAEPVVAMSILGFGVGAFFAAILIASPQHETAIAMSVNQAVRSVGFSIGSALGGLIPAPRPATSSPVETGYTVAAWAGVPPPRSRCSSPPSAFAPPDRPDLTPPHADLWLLHYGFPRTHPFGISQRIFANSNPLPNSGTGARSSRR